MIFRPLTIAEQDEFRQYARDNDPDISKWAIYHPVCRDEWQKRGFDPTSFESA